MTRQAVSRWENGTNMPDISLLIEIADLYGVDIRELIDGERKREEMNEETREVLEKVVDYTGEDVEADDRSGACRALPPRAHPLPDYDGVREVSAKTDGFIMGARSPRRHFPPVARPNSPMKNNSRRCSRLLRRYFSQHDMLPFAG